MDDGFTPTLSDFGLSREAAEDARRWLCVAAAVAPLEQFRQRLPTPASARVLSISGDRGRHHVDGGDVHALGEHTVVGHQRPIGGLELLVQESSSSSHPEVPMDVADVPSFPEHR